MAPASPESFWQHDCNYWFQKLNSSANGLSEQAAEEILKSSSSGTKQRSHFQKDVRLFISQFSNPLMLLLIGAVILSAFLGDTSDVFIILFIVLSTGLMSFFQERNAGRVVEKLQSMVALRSTALRDGKAQEIISSQLVSGDVLLLRAGDIVPADCLLIDANELQVNEASLTGESYPVKKEACVLDEQTELSKRNNCLWQGSNVVSGTASALVIHTGGNTIFGSIVQSASTTIETTFEKGIKDFGYLLMKITLVLAAFILAVNLLNHKGVIESALFALALAVGMAPELLPAITTIAMSAGAKRMLDKKVIVKKLSSIQNLGEVNLLCTDKTGTITEGAINVQHITDFAGSENDFAKTISVWNASLQSGYQNPIDDALKKINIANALPKKIGEIPYDFTRKRLSIAVDTGAEKMLVSKGAFAEMTTVCANVRLPNGNIESFASHSEQINKQFEEFGANGFRVIAVAYKNILQDAITKADETALTFAGFILLQDPVKNGIVDAINDLKNLQVNLKIISGDNKIVSRAIGQSIGIANPVVMTGKELLAMNPDSLAEQAKAVHIFAEVEPQQKEHIIQALRKSFTVAYMGDGINDVPAINAADIGISVENAVDVAREAADFVLLEKKLSVLADGIEEGRKTFSNTLKYIFINTGSTFGNMFSMAVASLILPFLPMLPKQILLTNFLTDFPYLAIASDNVDEQQLRRAGKWNLKFITNFMIFFGIHSSLFDIITFLTLLYVLKVKEATFQTGWFIESVLTELFILFVVRTQQNFFKSKPGKYLFILSVLGLMLTLALPYLPFADSIGLVPLSWQYMSAMLGITFTYIITADLLKVWFFKRFAND